VTSNSNGPHLVVVGAPSARVTLRVKIARAREIGLAHARPDAIPPQITLTWEELNEVDALLRADERKAGGA
jgi:hypothetical protein